MLTRIRRAASAVTGANTLPTPILERMATILTGAVNFEYNDAIVSLHDMSVGRLLGTDCKCWAPN
jgi:hypothetical protein